MSAKGNVRGIVTNARWRIVRNMDFLGNKVVMENGVCVGVMIQQHDMQSVPGAQGVIGHGGDLDMRETYVFSTYEKAEAFFSSWAREELKGVAEMDDELIEASLDILDMGELIEDRLDIRYDIEEVRLDPEF